MVWRCTYDAVLAYLLGQPGQPHGAGNHHLAQGHLLRHLCLRLRLRLRQLALLRRLLLLLLLLSLGLRLNLAWRLLLRDWDRLLLQRRPCSWLILG